MRVSDIWCMNREILTTNSTHGEITASLCDERIQSPWQQSNVGLHLHSFQSLPYLLVRVPTAFIYSTIANMKLYVCCVEDTRR